LLAAGAAPAFGISWIKSSDIPDPFSENIILGKVITEIRIEGNEETKESVIRRALNSNVGDIYTEELARSDRKWLFQLGVFTSIFFDTIPDGDGVILVVKVAEVNPYIPAPSIKITEENGLEIGVALSSANLFGTASRLSAYARFGGATNIGIRYKDPLMPDFRWWSGYQLDYFHMERRNKIYEFDESSDDFTLMYFPSFTNWLRAGPRISYLSVKSDQPDITLDPDNRDEIPGFGLSVQFDSRNMPVYPTDGWWAEILVSKFGIFGNDADYWQGNLDIRRYFEFGSPGRSLALYSLTTLTTGEVGVDIPIYMQFNIGGANTVRGWDLGAREGKNQFLNTIEYWHMLTPLRKYEVWFLKQVLGLQGAVFVDLGTAWTADEVFHKNWIGGAGIGLRLVVPSIVMVRFDLAVGEEGAGVGIYIGSQEKAVLQRDRVR
jgi:outer membrane protein assembly factor BamA